MYHVRAHREGTLIARALPSESVCYFVLSLVDAALLRLGAMTLSLSSLRAQWLVMDLVSKYGYVQPIEGTLTLSR